MIWLRLEIFKWGRTSQIAIQWVKFMIIHWNWGVPIFRHAHMQESTLAEGDWVWKTQEVSLFTFIHQEVVTYPQQSSPLPYLHLPPWFIPRGYDLHPLVDPHGLLQLLDLVRHSLLLQLLSTYKHCHTVCVYIEFTHVMIMIIVIITIIIITIIIINNNNNNNNDDDNDNDNSNMIHVIVYYISLKNHRCHGCSHMLHMSAGPGRSGTLATGICCFDQSVAACRLPPLPP